MKKPKKPKKLVINKAFAATVLSVIDKGLVYGLGDPVPGKMCVEAAVAFASGENHNDHPSCVDNWLADEKIELNDSSDWSGDKGRTKGLRRVAIAQLGSKGRFDRKLFQKKFGEKIWVIARDAAISKFLEQVEELKVADTPEQFNEVLPTLELPDDFTNVFGGGPCHYNNVEEAKYALEGLFVGGQEYLEIIAETMVQVLKEMKIPGTKYLYLTEKKRRTSKKAKKRGKKRK